VSLVDYLGLKKVKLTVITFIGQDYVKGPGSLHDTAGWMLGLYKGDGNPNDKSTNRSSYRTKHSVELDLEVGDRRGLEATHLLKSEAKSGLSIRYSKQVTIDKWMGKQGDLWYNGSWYHKKQEGRAEVISSDIAWASAYSSECPCTVWIRMKGRARDPVVPFFGGAWVTPYVDYQMFALFSRKSCNEDFELKSLSGRHDGFPFYLFFLDDELVHDHNPIETGEGIMSMYGSGEHKWSK
jgi:hypothetical protein